MAAVTQQIVERTQGQVQILWTKTIITACMSWGYDVLGFAQIYPVSY